MAMVLRITFIYFFLFIGLRLVGKREFGQLSPLELVTLLIIPEIVSQSLVQDDYSLTTAIIGTTTILFLVLFVSVLSYRFPTLGKVINSRPSILVAEGKLLEKNLNRERVSPDEILDEMHKAGLYKLAHVQWAILQSDGKIAIIPQPHSPQIPNSPVVTSQSMPVG